MQIAKFVYNSLDCVLFEWINYQCTGGGEDIFDSFRYLIKFLFVLALNRIEISRKYDFNYSVCVI